MLAKAWKHFHSFCVLVMVPMLIPVRVPLKVPFAGHPFSIEVNQVECKALSFQAHKDYRSKYIPATVETPRPRPIEE